MKTKKKTLLALLCMMMLIAVLPLQAFAASKKASIKLNSSKKTITVDSSVTLTATVTGKSKKVTWKSSNSKIASVSSKGVITAKKAGKVTITAKANGKTATCKVTVKEADYKSLYKKFLAKKSVKAGKSSITPKYFYVLNIDKTGVPELIVIDRTFGSCSYYVYTIKNNKVTYMGEGGTKSGAVIPTLVYSSKYKAIYGEGWTNGVGGVWTSYYGISGSKLVTKQHCHVWTNPKTKYVIGQTAKQENTVTKAKYNSFYKKYFTNGKLQKYEMIQNTAANRERYIK